MGFGEGVSPSSMGMGLGREHIAPSPENFSILSLKMATFSAFWALAHVARGHGATHPLDPPVDIVYVDNKKWTVEKDIGKLEGKGGAA